MNILKKTILCVAVAATTLTAIAPADAGERWRDHRYRRERNSDGDLVAAGIVGLAIGALAAGALNANRNEPTYGNPYRHPRPRPSRDYVIDDAPQIISSDDLYEPSYDASYEPWSRAWYRYCANRYRSFDPQTGTYVGYDGRERFCNAN